MKDTVPVDALVAPGCTILDAMAALSRGARQILLVVDDDRRLLGTVTDGDIRRGLLSRVPTENPVAEVMSQSPRTVPAGGARSLALAVMREEKIHALPVVDEAGRVVGLETIDALLRAAERDNWVVLMAGGEGRRLRPLTEDVPKPLLPVGKRPILETLVGQCARQGFRRLFLSVNYRAGQIAEHFGDGAQWGVRIDYLREDAPLGTAGSLGLLPETPSEPILVVNGDVLTSVDFSRFVDFHEDAGAAATMCVREYNLEVPFGVVDIDGACVSSISEKPVHSFFVNAGMYVLSPRSLDVIPKGAPLDMPDLIQKLIANGEMVAAFPLQEYWMDVGRLDDLHQARVDFHRHFE